MYFTTSSEMNFEAILVNLNESKETNNLKIKETKKLTFEYCSEFLNIFEKIFIINVC